MWTTRYRAVPPIGAVSAPLLSEIDRQRLILTVVSRCWAVTFDFDCQQPISGGINRGREKKNLESDIALRLHDSSPVGDFFSLCKEHKCLPANLLMIIIDSNKVCNFDIYCSVRAVHTSPPGCRYVDRPLPSGTAKNRPSTINFGRRRSIEGEIESIEGEKGKKKKRKRKKRREEENLVPVLARARSWPSLTVRRRTVARGSPTARTRARRRNASPRGEKDRGD
ncbi:hypothetical protein B296_00054512, partial [Ensete ventricosum]